MHAHPAIVPGNKFSTWWVEQWVKLLGSFSWKNLHRLATFLGMTAFWVGIRRRVVLDNLQNAFPEKSDAERKAIAQDAYINMVLVILEAVTSHLWTEDERQQRVQVENFELLESLMKQGKGVLLATGHFGNWETAGAHLAHRGVPLRVVVRRLKGAVNARLVQNRLASGAELILPRGAVGNIISELAQNHVVMQLLDQAMPPEHGVFVPFFGKEVSTSPGLSLAAIRSSAPVLVMQMHREGERLKVKFEGPIEINSQGDVRSHVATLTAVLEQHIRKYPGQWLWMHRRWKVTPPLSHPVP